MICSTGASHCRLRKPGFDFTSQEFKKDGYSTVTNMNALHHYLVVFAHSLNYLGSIT